MNLKDKAPSQRVFNLAYIDVTVVLDGHRTSTVVPGISSGSSLVEPLVDYFVHHSLTRSFAWMEKVREAVRLFLLYTLVNEPPAGFGSITGPGSQRPFEHFSNFSHALLVGTVNRETGIDPVGLCWRPSRASKVKSVVRMLTDFFDWVEKTSSDGSLFNPRYAGSLHDRLCAQAAFEARRSRAFLGHSWGATVNPASAHLVMAPKPPKAVQTAPPCFPDDQFESFLMDGFKVGGRHNFRDMLITLLLHGAGFRESEPFHLYLEDVTEDPTAPGSALVRIYHPSEGIAPPGWINAAGKRIVGNRREYLARAFGMSPRTAVRGIRHAGWKGGMHEDRKQIYKQAYWFVPQYGQLFWALWLRYMVQVSAVERAHPFAFVNIGRNGGEMYTIAKYEEAHAAAVRRIGLEPSKAAGLTPHGHRHAYAQRLKRAGFDPVYIQRMLHHASPESQEQYTAPYADDIRTALERAVKDMDANLQGRTRDISAMVARQPRAN